MPVAPRTASVPNSPAWSARRTLEPRRAERARDDAEQGEAGEEMPDQVEEVIGPRVQPADRVVERERQRHQRPVVARQAAPDRSQPANVRILDDEAHVVE